MNVTLPKPITIDGPRTITLFPHHLQIVLQALQELPYKVAHPVIEVVKSQLQMQQVEENPQQGTKEAA